MLLRKRSSSTIKEVEMQHTYNRKNQPPLNEDSRIQKDRDDPLRRCLRPQGRLLRLEFTQRSSMQVVGCKAVRHPHLQSAVCNLPSHVQKGRNVSPNIRRRQPGEARHPRCFIAQALGQRQLCGSSRLEKNAAGPGGRPGSVVVRAVSAASWRAGRAWFVCRCSDPSYLK